MLLRCFLVCALVSVCLSQSGTGPRQRRPIRLLRRPSRTVGPPPPEAPGVRPQRGQNPARPDAQMFRQYGRYHPLPFHMPASGEPHLKLLDVLYAKELSQNLPPMKSLNDIPGGEMDLLKRHFGGIVPWSQPQKRQSDTSSLSMPEVRQLELAPPEFPEFYREQARQGSTNSFVQVPDVAPAIGQGRSANPQKREAGSGPVRRSNAQASKVMDEDLKGYVQDSGEVFQLTPQQVQDAVARVERMEPTSAKDFVFERYNPLPSLGNNDASVLYIRGPLIQTPARDLMFEDTLHLENTNRVSNPNRMSNDFFWVPSKANAQLRQMLTPKANILRYDQ
ncbi:unnamed protein product [Cyprideis torosa]|uniref:Uncharacterized protein n=1 Tax=Cyprideis torosa TaxID=163714 RepID=A0A7R8WIN0_9CRUS|nr:unnamed protein product [Cyprideis torosa]CAG0900889.1 unnamed protein product [Cyprideis torosa]